MVKTNGGLSGEGNTTWTWQGQKEHGVTKDGLDEENGANISTGEITTGGAQTENTVPTENTGTELNWDVLLEDVVFSDDELYIPIVDHAPAPSVSSKGIVLREGPQLQKERNPISSTDKGKSKITEVHDDEGETDSDDEPVIDPRDFIDSDEEVDDEEEASTEEGCSLKGASTSRSIQPEVNEEVFGPHLEHYYEEQCQESEIPSEDELDDSSSEDEHGTDKPKIKKLCINGYGPWKAPFKFKVEMKFQSNKVAREYIRQYSAAQWYDIRVKKNERTRFTAACQSPCKWYLHASNVQGSEELYVKVLNTTHTCQWKDKNRNVSAKLLAKTFEADYRHDPKWPISTLEMNAKRAFGVSIGKSNKYRIKDMALNRIYGKLDEQYGKLNGYADQILIDNPGSTAKIVSKETPDPSVRIFERIYICLNACKEGFLRGCRPYIGVDACHLKHVHGGQLMTAVGVDGNEGIFPIAWAIVEGESKESWHWFLTLLFKDIGDVKDHNWVFMSDRQKGLVPALTSLIPAENIRYCLRHIYANFKNHFSGFLLKECVELASKATHVNHHAKHMDKMRELNHRAHQYMMGIQKEHWARYCFSSHVKCDRLLNNLSECFNAWKPIAKARAQPIFHLLEAIRRAVMKRFEENRSNRKLEGLKLCPRIYKRLELLKRDSRLCPAFYAGGRVYEVEDGDDAYKVNLNDHTCSCNKWQLTGIPCRHAISAIQNFNGNVDEFVHPYYHVSTYLKAYEPVINPVLGSSMWKPSDKPYLVPPKPMNAPGRPPKQRKRSQARIRDPDEPTMDGAAKRRYMQKSVRCSKCKEIGHNRKSCRSQKSAAREPELRAARGNRKRAAAHQANSHAPNSQPSITQPSSVASCPGQSQSTINDHREKLPIKKGRVMSMGFLVEDDRPQTHPTKRNTRSHVIGYGLVQDGNEQRIGYAWSGRGPKPIVPPPGSSTLNTRLNSTTRNDVPLRSTTDHPPSSSQQTVTFRGREKIVLTSKSNK